MIKHNDRPFYFDINNNKITIYKGTELFVNNILFNLFKIRGIVRQIYYDFQESVRTQEGLFRPF